MSDSRSEFSRVLDGYSRLAQDALRAYVSAPEPDRHLYEPIRAFTLRPRKSLRPALCLAACEAWGGTVDESLPSAVAVELLHTGFLIHDDIEDGSLQRRGQPTLHVERGVPIALNIGDALAVISLRPLLENVRHLGSRMARAVLAEFQLAMECTVEGQALELGWREDVVLELTPRDYLDMILKKTCAYTTILPLRVGALIGSWGTADLDAVARFGLALGAAFQIRDDVLDLVSEGQTYGKDVLGDLREGKRTLPLVHLLRMSSPGDRAIAEEFLSRPIDQRTPAGAQRVRGLMDVYASIDYANEYASEMTTWAVDAFAEAFHRCPPSQALGFLHDVVPFMAERTS